MTQSITIIHAVTEHIEEVAPLFDAYRCWYGKTSDLDGARRFLAERLSAAESEIFFLRVDNQPVAFTQLYPLFSSVAMERIWILNDLFVSEPFRTQGLGTLLLEAAAEFARGVGAIRLELETAVDNKAAQKAYEALGWVRDTTFAHYSIDV